MSVWDFYKKAVPFSDKFSKAGIIYYKALMALESLIYLYLKDAISLSLAIPKALTLSSIPDLSVTNLFNLEVN